MDLTTNGAIVTDAIKHVTQLQNSRNIINKCDKSLESLKASEAAEAEDIGKENSLSGPEEQQQPTHNCIF